MLKIVLLKEYQGHEVGKLIELGNNVAFGLIESGVARQAENRDFLVKPEFGLTKAFKSSPSKASYRKKSK